jgi:fructokinase
MTAKPLRLGVDLGGTKIEAVVLDAAGATLVQQRIAAPQGDYGATIEALAGLIDGLRGSLAAPCTVGIGMPGSLSPRTGLVRNSNSVWLNGRDLAADLQARLSCPARFENDANCFALSEATDGAGARQRTVFGVILGTGCGGGLVAGGSLIAGARRIGGEWGHNPLPSPSPEELAVPPCWCGRQGCLETWLSGTALAADHNRVTGEQLSAHHIAAAAEAGSTTARASLDRHAHRLARGLATIVNVFDPDVIVLGGGLSAMAHLYTDVPTLMAPFVFSDDTAVSIVPPRWGDASGVRGAAWLWP